MKKQRRILMCLEQLNIGGVETAVMTLCQGYIRAGHKVYVAAKPGIFSEQLKKMGVECLDLQYDIVNHYVLEQKEKLISFCKKNQISEIHIHQYPCVIYWLPVCVELNIPYVAYVHSIIPGAPEWFMRDFPVFRMALPIFFEHASKIVCIATKTKEDIENLFHVGDEHYKVIPNSLDLVQFLQPEAPKQLKVFGVVCRLSEEKMVSIKNAIDLFLRYSKDHKDCELLIAGDGPQKKELEQFTKKHKNIKYLGAISDTPAFMSKIDVFMGVDRCVLEAIATKRLVVISSYHGTMNLLTNQNIKLASTENFSGNNLSTSTTVLEELNHINQKNYHHIVDENYQFIYEHYNVDTHLYEDKLCSNFTKDYPVIFEETNNLLDKINLQEEKLKQIQPQTKQGHGVNKIRKIGSKCKKWLKNIVGR